MKEQRVTLRRYACVKSAGGKKNWTRRPVPVEKMCGPGKRGWEKRIDTAMVEYGPDVIDLGQYQICWFEPQLSGASKACYESVGDNYVEANIQLEAKKAWLNAARANQEASLPPPPDPAADPEPLVNVMRLYLDEREGKGTLAASSRQKFEIAFRLFLNAARITSIQQVSADALNGFISALKKQGLEQQTRHSYFAHVATFLRAQNPALSSLLSQHSPKAPPKKDPVSYDIEDVEALLDYCYSQPRSITRPNFFQMGLVAELYYKSGVRKKELSHLTWQMLDRTMNFFIVKDDQRFDLVMRGGRKKTITFHSKTRRDRELPIAADLRVRLQEWRKMHPHDRFVFPTKQGNPDASLLSKLRTVILHAGLNCGECDACKNPCGCCGQCRCGTCAGCRKKSSAKCLRPHHGKEPCTGTQCQKWTLHKMRHTCLTKLVGEGVDLKTVQDIAGHADLKMTGRYLSVTKKQKRLEAVNRVFASRSGAGASASAI